MKKKKKLSAATTRSASPSNVAEIIKTHVSIADYWIKQRESVFVRETETSRLNSLKLVQSKWKEIMMATKNEALLQQIALVQKLHAQQSDRKRAKTDSLLQCIKDTDAQFDTAFQSHLQNIENLITIASNQLSDQQETFETEVGQVLLDFSSERAKIQSAHLKVKNDLMGVVYRLEQDFVETESDATHEFQSQSDDVRNKNLEEKHALRIQLESTIDELWKQFQAGWQSYNQATEERKRVFEDLKKRDELYAVQIEGQVRKLQKSTDTIASIKQKQINLQRESEAKLGALRTAKEHIVRKLQVLKYKMNKNREKERRKLINLKRLSTGSSKKLNEHVSIAEKVLHFAEMNSKLCTEEEKARWSLKLDEEVEKISDEEKTNGPLYLLQHFEKIYNSVLLDAASLNDLRNTLTSERDALVNVLKTYIEGFSVSRDVMEFPNPLMVVNGKTNVILPAMSNFITSVQGDNATKKRQHIPVVDGNEAVKLCMKY